MKNTSLRNLSFGLRNTCNHANGVYQKHLRGLVGEANSETHSVGIGTHWGCLRMFSHKYSLLMVIRIIGLGIMLYFKDIKSIISSIKSLINARYRNIVPMNKLNNSSTLKFTLNVSVGGPLTKFEGVLENIHGCSAKAINCPPIVCLYLKLLYFINS